MLFLDLVGSTSYRQRYGAVKGLAKAHRHNLIASESIVRNGGEVVKWIGDSVMGVFHDEVNGVSHPYRALQLPWKQSVMCRKTTLSEKAEYPELFLGRGNSHEGWIECGSSAFCYGWPR